MISKTCLLGATLLALTSSMAHAGLTMGPGFRVAFSAGGQSVSGEAASMGSMTQVGDNIFHTGGFAALGAGYLEWDALIDPDPFINGTFSITNTSSSTQTFSVAFELDSDVQWTTSMLNGAFSGTLNDGNGDGMAAIGRAAGTAGFYSALIDAAIVQFLGANPYSYAGAAFGSSQVGPESFGPVAGGALQQTIGIKFKFTLSAGDSVSFASLFNVAPAPGAIALIGCCGLAGSRRRR